jgi:hypothetical protein
LFAYTRRFLFFFLSLLLLLHCFYLFLLVLIVSNFGSTKIYNCDRLAHTGRNMFVNQSVSFSLEKHHVMSLFFNMFSYYLPPSSSVSLRGPLLFCSNDEQQKGSPFVSLSLSMLRAFNCSVFRSETLSNKSIAAGEQQ